MIAILYPLKMTKNLSEAYSAIYEVSADLAIKAAKGAEKKRAESAKAGDTEGAKKAIGQNKKFFSYAKKKRQIENMPKKPTGPMASKPVVDYSKPYPGTGKKKVEEDTKAMKDFLDKKAKKLEDEKKNQKPEYKNNPAFGDPSHHSNAKSKNEAYDNRYSDNTGKESKEKLKKLEKKRGMKLKGHPQFTRDDVGKFRQEWEALKLIETENYREQFDTWLDGIVEEGYDIERWSDEELVDTFINENNLWASREAVDDALLEADKKGKGSGKKDACYHKVKASASVWPSAYASGRLVQCRKKGAANYGKSSKKEGFSDWRDDLGLLDENRATAYTAGMSDGQKAMEMNKISPKVADEAGRSHDKFMFGKRKKDGDFNKKYNKEVMKDKKYNQNTTGRGTPVSYRKGYEDQDMGRYQSKIRQGKGSFKDLGKKK